MRHQHVLDEVRVVEKVDILWAQLEIDYVAVLAQDPVHKRDRVAPESQKIRAQQFALRARRAAGDAHIKLLWTNYLLPARKFK
jgi:hypothetical protein